MTIVSLVSTRVIGKVACGPAHVEEAQQRAAGILACPASQRETIPFNSQLVGIRGCGRRRVMRHDCDARMMLGMPQYDNSAWVPDPSPTPRPPVLPVSTPNVGLNELVDRVAFEFDCSPRVMHMDQPGAYESIVEGCGRRGQYVPLCATLERYQQGFRGMRRVGEYSVHCTWSAVSVTDVDESRQASPAASGSETVLEATTIQAAPSTSGTAATQAAATNSSATPASAPSTTPSSLSATPTTH